MIRQEVTHYDNYEVKRFREYVDGVLIEEIKYNDKGEVFNARSWYTNRQTQTKHSHQQTNRETVISLNNLKRKK